MMMTPQQREKPNLTLYGIETQLLELLNFRESIADDPDMTPEEQRLSLEACDQQIAEYVRAEVKKCDGIASYLREFETRAIAMKEESDRCAEQSTAWRKRLRNLESMVISIMQGMKKDRIDGRHSVLQLKKNPASAEIQSPDLVPHEYQRVKVTMSAALWWKIRQKLALDPLGTELFDVKDPEAEPMKDKIREELKVGGSVPGCRLRTDSVRLEVK
jgi:hypothetical protein